MRGDRAAFQAALDADLRRHCFRLSSAVIHGPGCAGAGAEKISHTSFILVSGTIGEHAAIESLKAGATDYVLKQNPERLASAVRRAVQEAGERAKRRQMEMELIRREKYFRTLTENSLDVLCILSQEGNFLYTSPSIERVLGYTPEELRGTDSFKHVHPDDLSRARQTLQLAIDHPDHVVKIQFRYQKKDGEWRHWNSSAKIVCKTPKSRGLVTNWRDVTDRWRAEEELRKSERQYRLLFHGNPNPMWVFDLETLEFLEVNEAAIQHYGYSREEFLAMTIMDIRPPEKNGRREDTGSTPPSAAWFGVIGARTAA